MQFVNELLDRNPNLKPSRTKTDTLILKDGRKFRQLVDALGNLTPAGRAYEAKTGEALPTYRLRSRSKTVEGGEC